MDETADFGDLGDLGSFIDSVSNSFGTAFKAVNQPTSVPVSGAVVPGRPGYVYGPGGSILAVNPATGGVLPPVNSVVTTGASTSTVLIIALVAGLGVAFFLSLRK